MPPAHIFDIRCGYSEKSVTGIVNLPGVNIAEYFFIEVLIYIIGSKHSLTLKPHSYALRIAESLALSDGVCSSYMSITGSGESVHAMIMPEFAYFESVEQSKADLVRISIVILSWAAVNAHHFDVNPVRCSIARMYHKIHINKPGVLHKVLQLRQKYHLY